MTNGRFCQYLVRTNATHGIKAEYPIKWVFAHVFYVSDEFFNVPILILKKTSRPHKTNKRKFTHSFRIKNSIAPYSLKNILNITKKSYFRLHFTF